MNYKIIICVITSLIALEFAQAEDWCTYQHDNSRSGVTSEKLDTDLDLLWKFQSKHLPMPAWPEPAKNNYYQGIEPMRALVVHDKAFHVVISGRTAYFGSSADDKVYALDTNTGQVKWTFFTGGPIRLAPTVVGNRLYVGSDDGCVYCLSSSDGTLIWKYQPHQGNRILPGNQRLISILPVRAGIVVDNSRVYFTVGLFPNEGAYLVAVDSKDGSEIWTQQIQTSDGQAGREGALMSGQGYMLASSDKLYVPAGRVPPMIFSKDTGKYYGAIYGNGAAYAGTYALLTNEGLVSGPGGYLKGLHVADVERPKDTIAVFPNAITMVVKGDYAYVQTETTLSSFNRKSGLKGEIGTDKNQWTVKTDYPYSMIMAGSSIYSGYNGKVTAYSSADGKELWSKPIDGTAYGLAAADKKLFVSTDKGNIYCFAKKTPAKPVIVESVNKSSVYPEDNLTNIYAKAAKNIVEQTGIIKGYCLDIGSSQGRLALELAKITELTIVGVEEDAQNISQARTSLDAAGLHGRVSFMQGTLSDLPFNKYLFNLIVSDQTVIGGKTPANPKDVFRVLRPCGGTTLFGHHAGIKSKLTKSELNRWVRDDKSDRWKIITDSTSSAKGLWITTKRGNLKGVGMWTHQYAEPGNTSNAGDKLINKDLTMQWFGRPGPGRMADRHSRPPAPLSVNGRLFVRGEQYLYGVDAYNGTILWEKETPQMPPRVNMPQDNGYMVVDDDYFYAAMQDKCRKMDAQTGKDLFDYDIPIQTNEKELYNWGYLAYENDILYGSAVRKDAFYTNAKGPWYDSPGSNHDKICSDFIFALNKKTGKLIWRYDGIIINSALAIGDGKVYFVENRNPAIKAMQSGRIGSKNLWQDMYLVAIDAKTGKKQWQKFRHDIPPAKPVENVVEEDGFKKSGSETKPIGFVPGSVVFNLCYSDGTVVLVSSPYSEYNIYAYNAADGEFLWIEQSIYRPDGNTWDHGGHMQHPVIIDGIVYQDPHGFDLRTGKKGTMVLTRDGHSCGSLSGSPGFLFGRGSTPRIYDLSDGGKSKRFCSITRPGCWINIICANGLVLMPEAGSGCACAYPILTSMAYVPK